ncbi:serine/arginine repetitive matrix protein 2 [Streptomyces sp. NBC_01335]|uniref:serine/arginine repetitive matrix protein 2 n=1 Tax=Streptomyces sp. NBC_01335 TaxID=2903828 RepID=UPI002E1016D9|nr:serine/arginine repetitive matrix protein 2 [Streptomyces sp. NBC_01335]
MTGGGAPRWNDETQRWETGDQPPSAVLPPLPASPPVAPARPAAPPGPYVPPPPDGAPDAAPGGYVYGPDGRGGFAGGADPGRGGGTGGGFVGGFVGEIEPGDGVREERVGTAWQRFTPLTAGLTVGVLAACTAALWFTLAKDDDHHPTAQGASAFVSDSPVDVVGGESADEESAAEPTGEGPAPTDEETATATPEPGYATVSDQSGFTVFVPEEWRHRTEDDHGVYYTSDDGTSLLQVWQVTGFTSAMDAVQAASESRSASPGFQEISVEAVGSSDGGDGAELVYAYDHEATGTRRQVVDRVFTASDGRLYALLVAAPDTAWPFQEEILAQALAGFAPEGSAL